MTRIMRAFAFLSLLIGLWAGAASAQISDESRAFYDAWLATANRAEDAIENARASNAAFSVLRADLVDYRDAFAKAQSENGARIRVVQSQIEALGPPPDADKGETEPADIATIRSDLETQLDQLRVPVVVASGAFSQANGLIDEIDRIIRERKTEALLTRGTSPLNPAHWPEAFRELSQAFQNLVIETTSNWGPVQERGLIRADLPVIVILTVIGLMLLLRGRTWAEAIVTRLRGWGGSGTGVWSFVVSLLRIILPYSGLVLLLSAIVVSNTLGLRGELLIRAIPTWGAILLAAMWLGERVYSKRDEDALVTMSAPGRAAARRNLLALAILLVLNDFLLLIEDVENINDVASSVLGFIPILGSAVALFRLRQVGLSELREAKEEGGTAGPRSNMALLGPVLRQAILFAVVAAPLLAAVGYGDLASAIVFPMVWTLGLFGLVLVLQRLLTDIYALVTRKGDSVVDSIVPVLSGFFLVLAALPFLALIWGAETTDLTRLWGRFLEGATFGDVTISPVDFLVFAIVFSIGYGATRMLQGALRNSLLPKTRLDPGGQTAIVSGTGYVGIFLAALIAVTSAGLNLSSVAIVAGALSVGIGFGLQTIVSNFVSGIILLIERPIAEGDWIEVGGQMGYVRDISVRATRIETFDRTDVIVPNADLVSGAVTNYTHGKTVGRVIVPVGVAYGTDTRRVETILREIAEDHPMVLMNPPPNIVFQGFGADSLDFEIRAILRDVNWVLAVKSDMNHAIAQRFTEEGIEIPFAQRDVWLRNPETLSGQAQDEGSE